MSLIQAVLLPNCTLNVNSITKLNQAPLLFDPAQKINAAIKRFQAPLLSIIQWNTTTNDIIKKWNFREKLLKVVFGIVEYEFCNRNATFKIENLKWRTL